MQPKQQNPTTNPPPSTFSLFGNIQKSNNSDQQKKAQAKGPTQSIFSNNSPLFSFGNKSNGDGKNQSTSNPAAPPSLLPADKKISLFGSLGEKEKNQSKDPPKQPQNAFTVNNQHGWLSSGPLFGPKSDTPSINSFSAGGIFGKPKAQEGTKGKQAQQKQSQIPSKLFSGQPNESINQVKNTPTTPSFFTGVPNNNANNNQTTPSTPSLNFNPPSSLFGQAKTPSAPVFSPSSPLFGEKSSANSGKPSQGKQEIKSWGEKNQSTPEFKLNKEPEKKSNELFPPKIQKTQKQSQQAEKPSIFGKSSLLAHQSTFNIPTDKANEGKAEKKFSFGNNPQPVLQTPQFNLPKLNPPTLIEPSQSLKASQVIQQTVKTNQVVGSNKNGIGLGFTFGQATNKQIPQPKETIQIQQNKNQANAEQKPALTTSLFGNLSAPSPKTQKPLAQPDTKVRKQSGPKQKGSEEKIKFFKVDVSPSQPQGRQRLPTFDSKNESLLKSAQSSKVNEEGEYFDLKRMSELLSSGSQNQISQNSTKIELTFRKYMSISPQHQNHREVVFTPVNFYSQIKPEEGANKVINDFTAVLGRIFQIPPSSYQAYGQLLISMFKQLGYEDKFFEGLKIKQSYFMISKMYNISSDNMELVWECDQSAIVISQFIKYISSLLIKCLRKVEGLMKCFKKTQLYDLLLDTLIFINYRYPITENDIILQAMRANDVKLMNHLHKILSGLFSTQFNNQNNQDIISKKCVLNLILLADELPICPASKLFQKILLKQLNLDKTSRQSNKQLISKLDKTQGVPFMPFRAILYRLDGSKQKKSPPIKELLSNIDGPEWIDWLSIYLGEDNLRLSDKQVGYMIRSLKQMKVRDTDKILRKESQINRFISLMLHENQIKNFYETISTLIYDQESIKKVEKQYLKENSLHNDLRLLANEVRKYPNCEFNQEDMPELMGKSLYLLTVLSIEPARAFQFENALFDIDGFIEVVSDRCDRVCNLVIDILAYFSTKTLNQEIVGKSFSAITSLFQSSSTQSNMSLALAINRPQMDFLHKSISSTISKKIEQFLIHLLETSQFYTSAHFVNQNYNAEKAYPFRYLITRYLSLAEGITSTIPVYWFSNCLKFSTKLSFSPQLLQVMLSKLKIYPSSHQATDVPFILSTIVDASNQANFWKQLTSKIDASAVLGSDRYILQNKYMAQESDSIAIPVVFGSLNLLKTMMELHKIKLLAHKSFPRHFISQLLSSLNCLNQFQREYIQLGSQPELNSRKTVPPVISLLALVSESSAPKNPTKQGKIDWVYHENRKVNLASLNRDPEQIDYGVLKDLLAHPYNEYLDCLENISSLSCYVLKQLVPEIKDLSLDNLLYLCIPATLNNSRGIQNYHKLRQECINNLKECLCSSTTAVRRNAWNLVSCLRKTSQNQKFAKDVFTKYCLTRTQLVLHPSLLYLLEFVAAEARDHVYESSEILVEAMQKLQLATLSNIMEDIELYVDDGLLLLSLHQLARLKQERNIIMKLHYFRMCDLLAEIILREIYDNHAQAAMHSVHLIRIYRQTQFIEAFDKYRQDSLGAIQHISNPNIPRLYGKDILELYITSAEKKREELISVQVKNVENYFYSQINVTMGKVHSFLSVVLSINQTYYANHPIKLCSAQRSEIFCQRHLEPRKYNAYEFFSSDKLQAVAQLRHILKTLLKKVEMMKRANLHTEVLKMCSLLDLILGWLQSCRDLKKAQLLMQCSNVLSLCFNQLEQPIADSISAKLLLTCVNIMSTQMQVEMGRKIREAIVKTLNSVYSISSEIKQELISLFTILPPTKNEGHILDLLAKTWFMEENNQYFYNQCRVIYKLCQIYPFEMAQLKILSKCDRVLKFEDSTLQGVRYRQNLRTNQAKNWLWILKIATVLLENGMKSTLVVHQISRFLETNKKRLIYTFNQCRQDLSLKKQKDMCIKVNLAQLDELEASLEFFVVLAQSKMWIQMNRQSFEQLLYYLMHRTIVLFAPTSVGQKLRKKYIPQSRNQKIMWELQAGENLLKQQVASFSEGYDPDRIEEQYATQLIEDNAQRPSVFILAMSLRYNECLKLWLLGCSFGMRSSCFVREHFNRPIMMDARGNSLKYSLTHWEHLNKAVTEIMQGLTMRVREWGQWHAKTQLIHVLNDCLNSAQFFTEVGYVYSLNSLPQDEEQLIAELGESLAFALQMGACHLVSQIYFKNKTGTYWKDNVQAFQQKLSKLGALGEQKLMQNKINRQDPVLEHLRASKLLLSQVKCG